MKKVLLNWRYWVYMILGGFGMIMLFGVPADDSETWWADMLLSKAIAAITLYITFKLVDNWSKKGKIPELTKLMDEEL